MAAKELEGRQTQITQAIQIKQLDMLSVNACLENQRIEEKKVINITIRPAVLTDIDRLLDVCDQSWKGIWQGNRQMFMDRIITCPDYGILLGEVNGHIEGYVSVQLVNDDAFICNSWDEATDSGHLKNTHNPMGEWFHGIGLAVTSIGSKNELTGKLIRFLFDRMVIENKRGCRFVTRIPGYYRYKNKISPEEYVCATHYGRSIDPELRILENYGFNIVKPPAIYKNYVEGGGDLKSCGFSVLIEQINPYFRINCNQSTKD